MKKILSAVIPGWLFLYPLIPTLVPAPIFAQPQGHVDCALEWHDGRQVFTYVFTGTVSNQGKPSPNAKVELHISGPHQEDLVEETVASADGRYELKVAVSGVPEEGADWKLVAQAPETAAEAEIEGHTILMDQDTVTVQRPIELVQG